MSDLDKIGLVAIGAASFVFMLTVRMVQARIAPKWLMRFFFPPKAR